MAWETISANPDELDEEIANFQSGVTSIDNYEVAQRGQNRITAVIRYTP